MSLGNREGGTGDEAEPEDLPNLVRLGGRVHGTGAVPLHPAMDRTAGFFRVRRPLSTMDRGFFGAEEDAAASYEECKGGALMKKEGAPFGAQ